ncbi:ketopantoate reductase family protein [Microbacterium halophytorum]|uniref:ketopantoate reductase family protein n=1 Tax=Microbacterium halophytorum TaxID=2067568 RepID=UPI000CFBBE81|nr:ketopantoate reductase family protein [Microbacterium halophytorum]
MTARIAFIGLGALGAIYSERIATGLAESADVFAIADGDRADRLAAEGVTINGAPFRPRIERPDASSGPVELLVIATKASGLSPAIDLARPFAGAGTVILSLINGIHSEPILAEAFPEAEVLLSMTAGSDVERSGSVVSYENFGRIAFGRERNEPADAVVSSTDELLARAGVPHEVPADMERVLWWKFMGNVGINPSSALLDAEYGAYQGADSPAREVMRAAQRELLLVANARGVALTEADMNEWQRTVDGLAPAGRTSMLQDMRAARPTEIDIFSGEVARLGREHGIPTPVNDLLLNGIRARERIVGAA